MSLSIFDPTLLEINGVFEGVPFDLRVGDLIILEAVRRYSNPGDGVEALLRVGAQALQAVSAGLSVETVRRELESLRSDISREVSTLQENVDRTLADNGPLVRVITDARENVAKAVEAVVTRQANNEDPSSLAFRLKAVADEIDSALEATQTGINKGVRDELEQHTIQVNRLMGEMRDLDPSSALGGALSRIEAAVNTLTTSVAAAQAAQNATSVERSRGTAKGRDYEDLVAATVMDIAAVRQDVCERTGGLPGLVTVSRGAKHGDITCTVAENCRIVFEVMDRGQSTVSQSAVIAELEEAAANRGAQAAIAVMSAAEAKLLLGQPLVSVTSTSWAVVLDKDCPDPIALRIAYHLARHVALAAVDRKDRIDFAALRKGVEAISAKLTMLDVVRTQLGNIQNSCGTASKELQRFDREIDQLVTSLLDAISRDEDPEVAA